MASDKPLISIIEIPSSVQGREPYRFHYDYNDLPSRTTMTGKDLHEATLDKLYTIVRTLDHEQQQNPAQQVNRNIFLLPTLEPNMFISEHKPSLNDWGAFDNIYQKGNSQKLLSVTMGYLVDDHPVTHAVEHELGHVVEPPFTVLIPNSVDMEYFPAHLDANANPAPEGHRLKPIDVDDPAFWRYIEAAEHYVSAQEALHATITTHFPKGTIPTDWTTADFLDYTAQSGKEEAFREVMQAYSQYFYAGHWLNEQTYGNKEVQFVISGHILTRPSPYYEAQHSYTFPPDLSPQEQQEFTTLFQTMRTQEAALSDYAHLQFFVTHANEVQADRNINDHLGTHIAWLRDAIQQTTDPMAGANDFHVSYKERLEDALSRASALLQKGNARMVESLDPESPGGTALTAKEWKEITTVMGDLAAFTPQSPNNPQGDVTLSNGSRPTVYHDVTLLPGDPPQRGR